MAPTSRRAVIAVSNYSFTDTSTLQISWIYSYCVPGSQQRSTKGNRASPSGCIVLLRTRTSLLHYSKRGKKIYFAEQQYILIKKDKKIRDPVGGPGSSCSTALKRDDGPVRRLHQCLVRDLHRGAPLSDFLHRRLFPPARLQQVVDTHAFR